MNKISVIVPVYNVEAYLEECILSILRQTYREFELVLLDDGSTDKSGLICDQYAQRYPENIVVIHQENQGPLPTRIHGIKHAGGEIIVFLDSDDCLRKDALELLAECFQKESCDMVLFDAGVCPDYTSRQITHSFDGDCVFEKETKRALYQKLISYQIPNSVCLKAIRKDCAGLPECFSQFISVRHGEDLLMSAYFLTHCQKVVYLNKGLYYYRDRPGSAVNSFDSKRKDSVKAVHLELEKCIDVWGMPELRPLHNARKVTGWIDNLMLLLRNKKTMDANEYKEQLNDMAKDSYFRTAHENMDKSCVSLKHRLFAGLLYYGYLWFGCV